MVGPAWQTVETPLRIGLQRHRFAKRTCGSPPGVPNFQRCDKLCLPFGIGPHGFHRGAALCLGSNQSGFDLSLQFGSGGGCLHCLAFLLSGFGGAPSCHCGRSGGDGVCELVTVRPSTLPYEGGCEHPAVPSVCFASRQSLPNKDRLRNGPWRDDPAKCSIPAPPLARP
jgi:hypothetical protein